MYVLKVDALIDCHWAVKMIGMWSIWFVFSVAEVFTDQEKAKQLGFG
jgi:hypothetical protein